MHKIPKLFFLKTIHILIFGGSEAWVRTTSGLGMGNPLAVIHGSPEQLLHMPCHIHTII